MNKKMIKRLHGKSVRFRPAAVGFKKDDEWEINIREETSSLAARNLRTQHVAAIGFDQVVEYQSGFLLLKAQLHLIGDRVEVEPLMPWDLRRTQAPVTSSTAKQSTEHLTGEKVLSSIRAELKDFQSGSLRRHTEPGQSPAL